MPAFRNLRVTLEMIKWEHSIFVLPFALCGAVLAARGVPTLHTLVWIIVAMVAARSAAMAFNRLADADIDAANPRTAMRAIPAGLLSTGFVSVFVFTTSVIFVIAASQLNRLSLLLSPVALAIVLGYSYTKRFTRWSHVVLGLAMGIAPSAAWIAVRGSLDPRILLLTAAVMFWGAGFDILYSCQDFEFDSTAGLHSVPRHFGVENSLWLARAFHLAMVALLFVMTRQFGLGKLSLLGVVFVAGMLIYEHSIVSAKDLSRLNAAFFTMNGIISIVFFFFLAADVYSRR